MVEYFIFDKENSEYLIKSNDKFYRVLFIKDDDIESNLGRLDEVDKRTSMGEAKPLPEKDIPKELEKSLREEHPELF